MRDIRCVRGQVRRWMEEKKRFLIASFIFAFSVYFMLISQTLTNSTDGIWQESYFQAGEWEQSIGRWFWPYLDKIKFGISSISFNSFLALGIIVVSLALLLECFEAAGNFRAFLGGALFLAYPVICDSLSFGFMSTTFAAAMLFGCAAAYCAMKVKSFVIAIISGAFFISLSMGCYQAYIGVTCIIMLIYILKMLLQSENIQNCIEWCARAILAVCAGGLLYYICVKITCIAYDVELTDYNGANQVSLKAMIVNFPKGIRMAYGNFAEYFFGGTIQVNQFGGREINILLAGMFILILTGKIVNLLFSKKYIHTIGALLIAGLIPAACNVVFLIAVGTGPGMSVLMTGGMALLMPLMIWNFGGIAFKNINMEWVCCVLGAIAVWSNICTVTNDQLALKDGRTATYEIAGQILDDLYEQADIAEEAVLIMGRPSDNPLFDQKQVWQRANSYARFGEFANTYACNRMSWAGVYSNLFGVEVEIASDEISEKMTQNEDYRNMNIYPDEGYIKKIDGVWVIKAAEF